MNLTTNVRETCRHQIRRAREKGIAAVEFALTLPIWIVILLGCADAAYLMLISQRVDRVAYTVTDITTQSEMLTESDIANIFLAAAQLMEPFTFGEQGVVILTSLEKPAGGATAICWQRTGGGTLARASKIGTPGNATVSLPAGLTLNDNENIMIAEVYYDFKPMFMNAGLLSENDIYRVAVYKPRLSPLCSTPK